MEKPDRTLIALLTVFALVEFAGLLAFVLYTLSRPG